MSPSASAPSFSYYKLRNTSGLDDDEEDLMVVRTSSRRRRSSWVRLGRRWRRPRVRVAGLRRLLRRKTRVVRDAVRFSLGKVIRRLKEGRPYLGDLFAGNYMFMQVSPTPASMGSSSLEYIKSYHHHLLPPPSSSSFPRPSFPGRAVS